MNAVAKEHRSMSLEQVLHPTLSRRRLLGAAAIGGMGLLSRPSWAQDTVDLHVPGGPSVRTMSTAYPEKGRMMVQRTSPPWLETPFDVFDKGVFTPNDRHYVSWHWADFPTQFDLDKYRLTVHGQVNQTLSLSLDDILHGLPRFEIAAVSQCTGNGRMEMQPRVAGAQWYKGSMSNALWTGVRLKDVLDKAGVKADATVVRFAGVEDAVIPGAPKFMKSITVDHARDGEVMIAFGMNGQQIPVLNGFPLKLVIPGWVGTYWIKMLNDIEVLNHPDDNYWTTTAYRIPNVPHGNVKPGSTDFQLVPITTNRPRSFITNIKDGDTMKLGAPALVRGIAFGGATGVARVDLSIDGGKTWQPTQLGKDEGKYGFRQWSTTLTLASAGAQSLMVRCTNTDGEAQPDFPIWNPGGYMYNTIETTHVVAA
jgi:DMSO/TMAO reductase YedYZ molybdopterin-dependent catalytic subunit